MAVGSKIVHVQAISKIIVVIVWYTIVEQRRKTVGIEPIADCKVFLAVV
jgi:hypothetical protein